MICRPLIAATLVGLCFSTPAFARTDPPPQTAASQLPSDADIAALIDRRIAERPGQAMVVAVVGPEEHRVVARGMAGERPASGETLFEIASLTKVFTALLLSDMTLRGEVRLDGAARDLMPSGTRLPMRGREISLLDLATHRSGLPRLPANMPMADPRDPYADYSEALMLEALAGLQLEQDVGSATDYSNLGYGLLGHLLSYRAGATFGDLVRVRITEPLGMKRTLADPPAGVSQDMAPPHDAAMQSASRWHWPALGAAGAIVSNGEDLARFMKAALGLEPSRLGEAFAESFRRRADGPLPGSGIGLGWIVLPHPAGNMLFHNGQTGGYSVAMALDPARKTGVVVLANSGSESSVDVMALNILSAGRTVRGNGEPRP